jgi:hypothetical protein
MIPARNVDSESGPFTAPPLAELVLPTDAQFQVARARCLED